MAKQLVLKFETETPNGRKEEAHVFISFEGKDKNLIGKKLKGYKWVEEDEDD